MQHLKSRHISDYKDVELDCDEEKKRKTEKQSTSRQPTIQQSLQQSQPYPRTSPRCKKLDNALVDMIALDIQPTSIVEDEGFLKFIKTIDPRYEPPSRRTIMRSMLPQRYESLKYSLLGQLDSVQ